MKRGTFNASRERACEECGATFTPTRDCSTRTSKYCSRACGWAVQKRAADEATPSAEELHRLHHVEGLSVEAVGRHYGKSAWWAKQALARRGVPERGTRTGKTIACAVCGEEFYARASELRRGRRFCSAACKTKGMPAPSKGLEARRKIAEGKRGPKNPMWKGRDTPGSVYREFSIQHKREPNCRNCGRGEGLLHLHHIVPRSMCKAAIRDLRNGVPLCPACHLGWHRRSVVIHRDIFTPEEWAYVSSLDLLGQNVEAWLDDRYPARALEAAA